MDPPGVPVTEQRYQPFPTLVIDEAALPPVPIATAAEITPDVKLTSAYTPCEPVPSTIYILKWLLVPALAYTEYVYGTVAIIVRDGTAP